MKAYVVWLVAIGIPGVVLFQGCATYRDPATGEEARYGFQTLRAKLDLPIETVYGAAKKAATDLRLRFVRAAEDGISGEIHAMDAQYDPVDIRLGALPEDRTVLTISVGVFGDKNKSIVLFERITQNLSEAQQVAAAPDLQWGSQPARPPKP